MYLKIFFEYSYSCDGLSDFGLFKYNIFFQNTHIVNIKTYKRACKMYLFDYMISGVKINI